jgi:hypothetical protein
VKLKQKSVRERLVLLLGGSVPSHSPVDLVEIIGDMLKAENAYGSNSFNFDERWQDGYRKLAEYAGFKWDMQRLQWVPAEPGKDAKP